MEVRMLAARDLRPSRPDLAQRLQFQRGRPKIRRGPRRVGLRLGHMLLILALFAALFVGLEKAYLLSLTSKALAVQGLDLSGATDRTEAAVRSILEERRATSLLLLDTSRLEAELEDLSWVKEARVSKVWPSRLRVSVVERTPLAILKKDVLYLVDDEGVLLEPIDPAAAPDLPWVTDEDGFGQDYEEKMGLASLCLKNLSADQKKDLAVLDVSVPGRVDLLLKDNPAWVHLLPDQAGPGLVYFEKKVADWESRFGRLDYVDLTIPGRAVLGPAKGSDRASLPPTGSEKEVL